MPITLRSLDSRPRVSPTSRGERASTKRSRSRRLPPGAWLRRSACQAATSLSGVWRSATATSLARFARFDGTGHLDPTFGNAGTVVTNGGFEQNWTEDLAVQSDGKLVLAGFALDSSQDQGMLQLTRYTADGVLDSAFHTQGDVVINDGADYFITAVTLQSDGKIVVTGTRDGDFFVARFLTGGTRDISFGCTGMTGTDFGGDNDTAYNALVQSDGRIVAVGFGDPLVDPGGPSEQYRAGLRAPPATTAPARRARAGTSSTVSEGFTATTSPRR